MYKVVKEIIESTSVGSVSVEYVDETTREFNKSDVAVYTYDTNGVVDGLIAPDGSLVSLVGSGSMNEVFTGTSGTVTFSGNGKAITPLNASVDISATAGNSLTVSAGGLYVPTGVAGVAVSDTLSVDLSGDGTLGTPLTATVNLSSTAGNAITQTATGIYAPEASTVTTTSTTVQFTGAGTSASNLSAAVKLSSTAGNTLSITPTGLYNPVGTVSHSNSNNVTLTGAGTVASPLVATTVVDVAAGNLLTSSATGLYVAPLTVYNSDTSSVDFSGTGTSGSPLTASVKIGSDVGNVLVNGTNGLLVPTPTVTAVDSTSFNFTGTGAGAAPLTGDVIVSAVAGNILTSVATGLYVPTPTLLVSDTTTLDLSGDGSVSTPISGVVKISADSGNVLVTGTAAGLFVPTPTTSSTDTTSIDFSGNGTTATPLTASVIVSPNVGNELTSLANGLYSPTPLDTIQTAAATGTTAITAWNSVVQLPTLTGNIILTYPAHTVAIGKTIKVIQTGVPNSFTITHTPASGSISFTNAGGELTAANGAITLEVIDASNIRQIANSVAASSVTSLTYGRVNAAADLAAISFATTGVGSKIPFDATVYSSGVSFSGTDGITPTQAGRYRCSWFMLGGSGEFNDNGILHIVQNGVSLGSVYVDIMVAAGVNQVSSFLEVQLAAGLPVYLHYQPVVADSVAWGRGSYFDVSQLPTAVAPYVNTVAEYGSSSITNGSVLTNAIYANVPTATVVLPSAGTYDISCELNISHSVASQTTYFAVTDVSNDPTRIIQGSQTRATAPATVGAFFSATKSFKYVAAGPTTLYLLATSPTGTITFHNSASNVSNFANSALSYVKIAGQTSFISGLTTVDQTANGYFDLGDLRIQWGKHFDLNVDTTTVTLPVPFLDTGYIVTTTCSSGTAGSVASEAYTTSTFDLDRASTTASACSWSYIAVGKKP